MKLVDRDKVNHALKARDAVAKVFDMLGGVEALLAWAVKNPDKFYMFLWPRLLPREVKVEADVRQTQAIFNVVEVTDARTALNALERRLYDETHAHSGGGGGGDAREVDGEVPTHASRVQEVDGAGAGSEQQDRGADAAETRQDHELRVRPALSLCDVVPVA